MKQLDFDGPCALLLCVATGPHSHPICTACGAVAWGNLTCQECRSHWDSGTPALDAGLTPPLDAADLAPLLAKLAKAAKAEEAP